MPDPPPAAVVGVDPGAEMGLAPSSESYSLQATIAARRKPTNPARLVVLRRPVFVVVVLSVAIVRLHVARRATEGASVYARSAGFDGGPGTKAYFFMSGSVRR